MRQTASSQYSLINYATLGFFLPATYQPTDWGHAFPLSERENERFLASRHQTERRETALEKSYLLKETNERERLLASNCVRPR